MYRQKRVKGGRTAVSSAMLGRINRCIEADARRFNVGKSFVLATIAAIHYNIKEQEDYRTVERRRT